MSDDMREETIKVKPLSELYFWCSLNDRQLQFMDMQSSLLAKDQKLRTKGKRVLKVDWIFNGVVIATQAIAQIKRWPVIQAVCVALLSISIIAMMVLELRNLKERKRNLENLSWVTEVIEVERQGESPLTRWNHNL